MGRKLELKDKEFHRLIVLGESENRTNQGRVKWWCQCSCGSEPVEVEGSKLVSGHTRSCGCYNKEKALLANTKHGEADKTPEYRAWQAMKTRCLNKKTNDYRFYGERGITVCEKWLDSFENFLEDMGRKPSKHHSLDRIDNSGNYEPSNCKWSSKKEQVRNRRNTKYLTYNNITKPLAEWAENFNIKQATIRGRLDRGWSVEKALTTPVKNKL